MLLPHPGLSSRLTSRLLLAPFLLFLHFDRVPIATQNPNFLSLLAQNQQGADASSLPPAIRKRVQGLQGVQAEHAKIESEFQLEILALEKKVSPVEMSSRSAYDQAADLL